MKLLVGGTWDLFHWGHLVLLQRCREIACYDHVVVAVNPDEFVLKYKGHKPVMNTLERVAMVKACKFVDEVIINPNKDCWLPVIKKVNPNAIVVGSDWASKDYYALMKVSRKQLTDMGIYLIYLEYTKGISSTEIKRRLK